MTLFTTCQVKKNVTYTYIYDRKNISLGFVIHWKHININYLSANDLGYELDE